jgi:plasmid maintenance system antidote protein VapI
VKERRGITADTAARLAKHFGGDAASWLALQAQYDLKTLPTRPRDRKAGAAARTRGGSAFEPKGVPLRRGNYTKTSVLR